MKTLKEFKAAGAFVPDQPIKKDITFQLDGDQEFSATVFVRKLSIADQEAMFLSAQEEGRSRSAVMIAHCISLGEEGKEKIPFREAYKMHPGLANALVRVIGEVNPGSTPIKKM